MLNGRLYSQGWFIATLALLVAFLTLRPPDTVSDATPPVQFAGSPTIDLARQFQEAAPLRVPGTVGAAAGEKWITDQFTAIAADDRLVTVQHATVRRRGEDVPIANVVLTVPARAQARVQRRIVVVAPRDAPRQVSGGTSSTAILVALARFAVQQRYHHPIVFVSVDADTYGNAGFRWYLSRETPSRIAGLIVLDAPGEGLDAVPVIDPASGRQERDPNTRRPLTRPAPDATTMYLWSGGSGRQALDMRALAERAVASAGFSASPLPSLRRQLLGLAFTETRGDQRPAIDLGIPAITLSARRESPLPVGVPAISLTRVRAAGIATLALIGLLDNRERARVPDRALVYAGRILRPSVSRLALLFLALPIFILALDAASRVRRSRVRLAAGLRGIGMRLLPGATILLLGWLLTLWGVLRAPDVGRPAAATELAFDGQAALALLLVFLTAVAVSMVVRPRVERIVATNLGDGAAALIVVSIVILVAWWHMPYALVLILPPVHAMVAAALAPRLWQVVLAAMVGILVPLALVLRIAGMLERNPLYALWYLTQTTLSGARGLLGPVIAVVVVVAMATLAAITVDRIRHGVVDRRFAVKGPRSRMSNLSSGKRKADDGPATEKTRP